MARAAVFAHVPLMYGARGGVCGVLGAAGARGGVCVGTRYPANWKVT